MKKTITLLLCFGIAAFAEDIFADIRDGKKYKTVKIGNQVWMAQNLEYSGSDGYLGLCYGDDPKKKIRKPENCRKYGRLYNWEEAMEACPTDWRLPSYDEWQTLVNFAGGDKAAGKKLKAKNGWNECKWIGADNRGRSVNHDYCGTDEYGFSTLPGGLSASLPLEGSFLGIGSHGAWWSASKHDSRRAYSWYMGYSRAGVAKYNIGKEFLHSVRCIQGKQAALAKKAEATGEAGEVLTDTRDGKKYKTVKIGNKTIAQTWMAENLNYVYKDSNAVNKCYDNEAANCNKYGRLYNWEEATGVCPTGWHLPSDKEWQTLLDFAGGNKFAGKKLKAKNAWENNKCLEVDDRGRTVCGTNDYGFSALPGGFSDPDGLFGKDSIGNSKEHFYDIGVNGKWWSATELNINYAYFRSMNYYAAEVSRNHLDKSFLYSVRCVKD